MYVRHRFRKAPFSKCFPPTLKRKAGVYEFILLTFEKSFEKAPVRFRDVSLWTVGLTVEINLRFKFLSLIRFYSDLLQHPKLILSGQNYTCQSGAIFNRRVANTQQKLQCLNGHPMANKFLKIEF